MQLKTELYLSSDKENTLWEILIPIGRFSLILHIYKKSKNRKAHTVACALDIASSQIFNEETLWPPRIFITHERLCAPPPTIREGYIMLIILIVIGVVILCVYLGCFSCTWKFASLHFRDFVIFQSAEYFSSVSCFCSAPLTSSCKEILLHHHDSDDRFK